MIFNNSIPGGRAWIRVGPFTWTSAVSVDGQRRTVYGTPESPVSVTFQVHSLGSHGVSYNVSTGGSYGTSAYVYGWEQTIAVSPR